MHDKNWTTQEVNAYYEAPFLDLLFQAQAIHRQHFKPNEIQLSKLLSIKSGACPEDCAYCPQSGHYNTGVKKENLIDIEQVVAKAVEAKAQGATRFCMGAAWRNPPKADFPKILAIVSAVKKLGLETCMTLGMLDQDQALELKKVGLDYYNHNLDTSPEYYKKIITTRTYQDRLDTLKHVRESGLHVCCGGIIGMGETREDRVQLLVQLANLPKAPESVPINRLNTFAGTPLEQTTQIDNFEFVRTIAIARIMMPMSMVRLSAGRAEMSEEMHALCFMAGANSIFIGDKLFFTDNQVQDKDIKILAKLGITSQNSHEHALA